MRVTTVDDAIRRSAEEWPDALALADAPNRDVFFAGEPLRLTWSEVDRAVDNLATSLTTIGAGPDVAVAVQLPNVVETCPYDPGLRPDWCCLGTVPDPTSRP